MGTLRSPEHLHENIKAYSLNYLSLLVVLQRSVLFGHMEPRMRRQPFRKEVFFFGMKIVAFLSLKQENQAAIGCPDHQTIGVFSPEHLARSSVNTGGGNQYLLI